MQVQTQHRFSVEDYYRMGETGVIRPDARVELLEGQVIDMPPIGPFHGGVVKRLLRILSSQAKGRWIVSVQNPLHLDDHSEPQPDVMLLRPAKDDYVRSHPRSEDVFLLIEVADTSLDYDCGRKLVAYGRAGVAEVWIVNLNDESIEVHREPHFTGYSSKSVARFGDQVQPLAFPDLSIDVSELLRL